MKRKISNELYNRSRLITPGGIHNPARSFKSMGELAPLFISKGDGSHIWDEDGFSYLDLIMGWGVHILGHAHPQVVEGMTKIAKSGPHFGTPTRSEFELNHFLVEIFPSIEMLRFVNSGSEAVMAAIRTARTFTGRSSILKFLGCYHGWYDDVLVGSLYRTDIHDSSVFVAPYNDLEQTSKVIWENFQHLAAVIIEPVAGNMGVIPSDREFLLGLRKICDELGILLIFDEVMTGFRVAFGGAQIKYDVMPDLTCLGKIIGGGLPIGAYGGRKDVMSSVAPLGKAYQGGTYSGNPLSTSTGLIVLNELQKNRSYSEVWEQKTTRMYQRIKECASLKGINLSANIVGGMFTLFFCSDRPFDYVSSQACNTESFSKFFRGMLDNGIYWPPGQFEAAHLSLSHSDNDLDMIIQVASIVFENWEDY